MSEANPARQFFGSALFVVGAIIATLSGLCSAFGLIGLSGVGTDGPDLLALVAVFGGPPLCLGAGMVWAGWRLIRVRRPRSPPPGTFE